jgi:hypothetical protein
MKNLLFLLLFSCFSNALFATHYRAGEIRYEQIAAMQYRITVITYTKESAVVADRDSILLEFGDGTRAWVARINGMGISLGNNIQYNEYVTTHTYTAFGTYLASMQDINRSSNILNIDNGFSEVPFYLESMILVRAASFGTNNSVHLLQPPIDIAQISQPFAHNPSAFDADGDSIVYELIAPLRSVNTPVPNYVFPNFIPAGGSNSFTLNATTGDILWTAPQTAGEYSIAMRIKEFRNGILIGNTVRDMQVLVKNGGNQTPTLSVSQPLKIVLIAGATLPITVSANDANAGQRVQVIASSGAFLQSATNPNPATFGVRTIPPYNMRATNYLSVPNSTVFEWQTQNENIRKENYQILFKGLDNNEVVPGQNGTMDTLGLNTSKSIQVTIIGAAPNNLTDTIVNNRVLLEWDKPYIHENIGQNRFKGFSVWRKNGNNILTVDSFNINPAAQGFTRIARNVLGANANKYIYNDATAQNNQTYTYWITAEFADLDHTGTSIHAVNSLPISTEIFTIFQNIEEKFARVFPTFFRDVISIQAPENTVSEATLYNNTGQIILNITITGNTTTISTQGLPQGGYLMVLKNIEGEQSSIKLFKK